MIKRQIIIIITNGIIDLIICAVVIFATFCVRNRHRPTGGVMRPRVRLKITMMPK